MPKPDNTMRVLQCNGELTDSDGYVDVISRWNALPAAVGPDTRLDVSMGGGRACE